ncbi:putative Ca2+/H+ antiporter (TMEM165/GDT1 family) [Thiopseudomonas denitrificans]|uniref:GDT1 family protein n=2 Tax=Thiopseudomonas denitrificans TaxID=1501432 RepID=A0A4R6TXW7_9GAMM|nr:putative Ca2+/H+ antiporter (TMEM165/GDT1 family) [Thiopseudomonas denitrificans]
MIRAATGWIVACVMVLANLIRPLEPVMFEALFVSTGIVTLAEIGDKTQLLAFILAARFLKPVPIIWGILVATVLNHALAAAVGNHVANYFSETTLLWLLAASFLAVAAWTLIPDKMDDGGSLLSQYGPFVASLVAFFVAEMGDKTQVATVMLAAQYPWYLAVVAGTTLGMLLANVPVVLVSNFAAARLPLTLIRSLAALCFLLLALYAAIRALGWLA